MPKYSVSILQAGLDSLEAGFLFIANDSVQTALRWHQQVLEKIQSLEHFPERCPIAEESRFFDFEVRQLIVGSYRILYRIVKQEVQVLHVKHGAQQRLP